MTMFSRPLCFANPRGNTDNTVQRSRLFCSAGEGCNDFKGRNISRNFCKHSSKRWSDCDHCSDFYLGKEDLNAVLLPAYILGMCIITLIPHQCV